MEWKCSYSRLGQQPPTKSHSPINDVSADSEGSESTKRGYCRSRVDSQPEEMGSNIGCNKAFYGGDSSRLSGFGGDDIPRAWHGSKHSQASQEGYMILIRSSSNSSTITRHWNQVLEIQRRGIGTASSQQSSDSKSWVYTITSHRILSQENQNTALIYHAPCLSLGHPHHPVLIVKRERKKLPTNRNPNIYPTSPPTNLSPSFPFLLSLPPMT